MLPFISILGVERDIVTPRGGGGWRWPDGMVLTDSGVWVGAESHRPWVAGLGWGYRGDMRVVVTERVEDAELLGLRGVRACWCGAAWEVRMYVGLCVSERAYRVALGAVRGWDTLLLKPPG